MIVFHPYRSLRQLQTNVKIAQDDFSLAWSIINDHYHTDLPLLYPPHTIAVTSVLLALTLRPNITSSQSQPNAVGNSKGLTLAADGITQSQNVVNPSQQAKIDHFTTWLAGGQIQIEPVIECCQEMISMYSVLDQNKEPMCEKHIVRYLKARGLDK